MPHPNLTVSPAREGDIADIMNIILPAFAHIPVETTLGNTDTPAGRQAACNRHIRAWRAHAEISDVPCAIKCVHTDPTSGKETIVGFGECFIYPNPSTPDQHEQVNWLISGEWLEYEPREAVQRTLFPVLAARRKWLHGRPCAVVVYIAVSPTWRRQGAASMIMQWGVDRCRELGVMAYLEATEEGRRVYERCGFEVVEIVRCKMGEGVVGEFPAMVLWPPGTGEEGKVPAVA